MARSDVIGRLAAAGSMAIVTHVNPDGDAIGSLLGLSLALRRQGKHIRSVSVDPVPWSLTFLPGADAIVGWDAVSAEALPDLVVSLDCSDLERTGMRRDGGRLFPRIPLVEIDHHVTNTLFGDVCWVDPGAACVGLMVFELLSAMDIDLDPDMATCLLTTIYTDTGSFQYSNADPRCMRAAADLIELGARHTQIAHVVFRRKRFATAQLWGLALSTLTSDVDGHYVEACVTLAAQQVCGLVDEGTEGLVEYLAGIDGADLAAVFREAHDGSVKVSLRSSERVDASVLATILGGGGHPRAAGASLSLSLEAARDRVREAAFPVVRQAVVDSSAVV